MPDVERHAAGIDATRADVAGRAIAHGRKPHGAPQRRPAARPFGDGAPADRHRDRRAGNSREGLQLGGGQRFDVPAQRVLIEEPRCRRPSTRSWRLRRRGSAPGTRRTIPSARPAPRRQPARGTASAAWPASTRRGRGQPVRAWQARLRRAPRGAAGVGGAARVGPHVDRCQRLAGRVEAEQAVPEGGDADGGHVGRPRPDQHGVQAGGHRSSRRRGSCSTPPSAVSVGRTGRGGSVRPGPGPASSHTLARTEEVPTSRAMTVIATLRTPRAVTYRP